jgi:flagellum-specific peptidoglycan hydrolase FlgJ
MGRQPPPNIIAAAQSAEVAWKIPASVILAQWALESGWGAHTPPGSNNPFGEKALPSDPSVASKTTEVINGRVVPINAPFRAFTSIAEAFAFHAEHLATSHFYIAARACLPDIEAFCVALGGGTPQAPRYSTNPQYGAELMAIIRGSDLIQYDAKEAVS